MLAYEAQLVLRKYKPRVIAVTGNVGKTSTKDAIYAVISTRYNVRKSEKSYNSEIGVPLTILGCPNGWSSPTVWLYNLLRGARLILTRRPYPEYLVLEVGADHPGDIRSITRWLRPAVTVLTRMSDVPVHVEFFDSPEAVLREKMYLAEAVVPNGTIVVNADDPSFMREVRVLNKRTVTFGTHRDATVRIGDTIVLYGAGAHRAPIGQTVELTVDGRSSRLSMQGFLGSHLSYPFAAASAVAYALGMSIIEWERVFAQYDPPRGRMRLLSGIQATALIDDSYNSSPLAVLEALHTLEALTTKGRKIVALGDMKELGTYAQAEHEKVGLRASHVAHTVVAIGELARGIASAAQTVLSADRVYWFADSHAAADFLKGYVRAGDVVLIKGSQSIRMERITRALLAHNLDPKEYLVRQEEEWIARP